MHAHTHTHAQMHPITAYAQTESLLKITFIVLFIDEILSIPISTIYDRGRVAVGTAISL